VSDHTIVRQARLNNFSFSDRRPTTVDLLSHETLVVPFPSKAKVAAHTCNLFASLLLYYCMIESTSTFFIF
jgi:hypothetical protein